MRCKLLLIGAAMLAFAGSASALSVPLPPAGNMTVDAFGAFSEIFLQVNEEFTVPGTAIVLTPGMYNNFAIGWSEDSDPVTPGAQPDFVLYSGAMSSSVIIPPGGGTVPTAPGTIIAKGAAGIKALFEGTIPGVNVDSVSRGRLYVGGTIQSITTSASFDYNLGGIGGTATTSSTMDTDPDPQLTFSVYNAYIETLTLSAGSADPGISGGVLLTDIVLSDAEGEEVHLDVWADDTPDASLGSPSVTGMRYEGVAPAGTARPELPVRGIGVAGPGTGTLFVDVNEGTYYDRDAGQPWKEIAFAGDPADDDVVWWSFVGNTESFLRVREQFEVGPAEFFVAADGTVVYISGPSSVTTPSSGPPSFAIIGQFIPGASKVSDASKTDSGYGFGNGALADDYKLTAAFEFGGANTGAYDSDPNTFTFQQGQPGSVGTLTQLEGKLVPEPATMAGLVLGLGGLVRYIRKRR